jgi:hypothetical protein
MGYGVWGMGYGVWGMGYGVWGMGYGVSGIRYQVSGIRSRRQGFLRQIFIFSTYNLFFNPKPDTRNLIPDTRYPSFCIYLIINVLKNF